MKLIRSAMRSSNAVLFRRSQNPNVIRAFSASPIPVTDELNSSDSFDDSEQRNSFVGSMKEMTFGDGRTSFESIYRKLGKAEKAYDRSGTGSSFSSGNRFGLDGNFDSLSDGMDYKLKKAASYFEYDPVETNREDYSFRPDVNFNAGMTYDTKDLDLRKPGVRKVMKRYEFQTTTDEVLEKADFRNVKFLANFITEAGIIIKRSQTGISAKAQRKVAREIKTARAFGLMPFTAMGTKRFVYGQTMENVDTDFEYDASSYDHIFVDDKRGSTMDA